MTTHIDFPLTPEDAAERIRDLQAELIETRNELGDLKLQLDILSTTDALTGLPNIHGMVDLIEDLTARITRNGEPFGIMMIHVPELVTLAAEESDENYRESVRHAAGLVVAGLRQLDRVGRIDSATFLVTLPQLRAQGVDAVVDRIAKMLHSVPLSFPDGASMRLRPEIGVVVSHPNATKDTPALLDALWDARDQAGFGSPCVVAAPDASKPYEIHLK